MSEPRIPEWQEIVWEEVSHLVGKVLTKIEAAFSEETQRESFKKIVEQDIYDARNLICRRLAELREEEN